jgi:hypothetical protein
MSLNGGTITQPDSWADNPDGGMPQHHQHQPSSPAAAPPQVSHEDQLDRQMLRHLMRKYTAEGLSRLMQEENGTSVLSMCSIISLACKSHPALELTRSPRCRDSFRPHK